MFAEDAFEGKLRENRNGFDKLVEEGKLIYNDVNTSKEYDEIWGYLGIEPAKYKNSKLKDSLEYLAIEAFPHVFRQGEIVSSLKSLHSKINNSRQLSESLKSFGFYVIAFAIALRISKLTLEALDIVRK